MFGQKFREVQNDHALESWNEEIIEPNISIVEFQHAVEQQISQCARTPNFELPAD
jgi:hypothetical protein